MITIRIQAEDFDVGVELARLKQGGAAGAVVTFTGIAREDDGVSAITLEHYPGMTEREIAKSIVEAQSRWAICGATVIHRIGTLKPGDNIVLVVVAARHRQAAFEAAQFLMDYLKAQAPLWKREQRGNTSTWVNAKGFELLASVKCGSRG